MTVDSIDTSKDRVAGQLEVYKAPSPYQRTAYLFMTVLVVYAIARGLRGAVARPFWFDELLTLTTAGQATLHGMWTVIRRGFDVQPPLFYLIERLAVSLPIKKEVALRLPSILAFPCTLLSVFHFAKRRNGELLACVCAFLLLSTSVFHTYLVEARPYSMVIACIALAMVCYQRVASWRWTVLFAVSLTLAQSLHYYAVFAMIPFWLAEGVVLLARRRFRWEVWLALICGIVPLVVSLRLPLASKAFYGAHNYALPDFTSVRNYYSTFLLLKDNTLGVALALVAVVGIVRSRFLGGKNSHREGNGNLVDWPQGVLLVSVVALPMIVFVLVRVVHGTLLSRYVLAATLGLALGMTAALALAGRKAAGVFAVFVFCVVGIREWTFWRHPEIDAFLPYPSATSVRQLDEIQQFVERAEHTDLPVVMSDSLIYSQMVYYGRRSWTDRLVFLADEQRDLRYVGSDTSSKTMLALREFFPIHVADYSEFTATHPEFLLYSNDLGWYLKAFVRDAAAMELLEIGNGQVYLIKMRPDVPRRD